MKKTNLFFPALTISLSLAFSGLACGNSPLLNHENAKNHGGPADRVAPPPPTTAPTDCPLEFPKNGLCASFTWDTELSSDEENNATIRFWDKASANSAGPYRDAGDYVAVVLWMPDMGHGSSPVLVTHQGTGIYSASRAFFVMPGEWEVRVQIKQNHQIFEQATFNVKL